MPKPLGHAARSSILTSRTDGLKPTDVLVSRPTLPRCLRVPVCRSRELLEEGRHRLWVREHPPVARTLGRTKPGAGPFGGPLGSALSSAGHSDGISQGRQREPGRRDIGEIRVPVLVNQDRGPIRGEDRVCHRAVEGVGHDESVRFRYAERNEGGGSLGSAEGELRVHPLFTLARRLPDPCQGMPDETSIHGTRRVRHPTRDEIRPKDGGTYHEDATPVVADEVDWLVVTFEHVDQPIGVALRGRLLTLRHKAAKARHAERDVAIGREVIAQVVQDPVCLGDFVAEQDCVR